MQCNSSASISFSNNNMVRHLQRIMKSPDPLEEQRRKEIQLGDKLGSGTLFG